MSLINASSTALSAVVNVAETGSFGAAARRMGLSPSATSKAISRLEETLGTKLFHRTTRRVALTPEGDRLVRRIAPLVRALDTALADTASGGDRLRGRLRLSAPPTFGRERLAPRIAAFANAHPDLIVELTLSDRFADLVGDSVDVAVRSGALGDSASLVAKRVFADRLKLVAAKQLLADRGAPDTPADLSDYPAVAFRNAETGRVEDWTFAGHAPVAPASVAVADDMHAVAQLAKDGMGIAQLPGYLADTAIAAGELIEVLPAIPGRAADFHALYLERRLLAPAIRAFVDFLAVALQPAATTAASRPR